MATSGSSRPAGLIAQVRRPSVRGAGRAQRRNLPVLLRLFKFSSSSSSLHAFNFLLQSLSSIFCIDFGCLGRLFLPSIILPIGLRIPPGPSDQSLFSVFFVFFCLLFFCYFFGLFFLPFLVILRPSGDPKIKPKLAKICFGRGFLDEFDFCVKF